MADIRWTRSLDKKIQGTESEQLRIIYMDTEINMIYSKSNAGGYHNELGDNTVNR